MSVATEYAFSNSVPQAPQQLGTLAYYLDPITAGRLAETGVGPGAHCLELGPGGGSIAAWLADRVGPTGQVVVVDRDLSQLPSIPDLEVVRHDLHQGLPEQLAGQRFDLIHARLVLVHLANRRELLQQLVDALAPGGWLVLGEFGDQPLLVFTADSDPDAALFTKVVDIFRGVIVQRHGVDFGWAHQVHGALAGLGLTGVRTTEYAESWTGGERGCQLHVANMSQLADRLISAGLTQAELARFHELMADPTFSARSWQFVCAAGQKPLLSQAHRGRRW